jgi:hypothetical protein
LIGLLLPVNAWPFDNVPLHGPVPVTAILNVALLPAQIVCVPLITPVGRGFTVTVTEVRVALTQPAAVNASA